MNLYKFEPKIRDKETLHETDSEDDSNSATTESASATATTGSATIEETNNSLNDTNGEEATFAEAMATSPVVSTDMVSCVYCEKFFKKGGIKIHYVYCKKRPNLV